MVSVWSPATCFPDACFCEAIRDSLVLRLLTPPGTVSVAPFRGRSLTWTRSSFDPLPSTSRG